MAAEFFLEIITKKGGKIKGEALSSLCPEQIEVSKFTIGMTSPGGVDESGQAVASGRIELEEAEFDIGASTASTPLFQTLCTNDPIKTATLSCLKAGHNGKTGIFLQWRFNDARLTSFKTNGDEGGKEPGHTIKIAYSGVEIQYKQQKKDGTLGNGSMAAYDAGDNAMSSPTLK